MTDQDPAEPVCGTCGQPVDQTLGHWIHTSAGRPSWTGTLAELTVCADGAALVPPTTPPPVTPPRPRGRARRTSTDPWADTLREDTP